MYKETQVNWRLTIDKLLFLYRVYGDEFWLGLVVAVAVFQAVVMCVREAQFIQFQSVALSCKGVLHPITPTHRACRERKHKEWGLLRAGLGDFLRLEDRYALNAVKRMTVSSSSANQGLSRNFRILKKDIIEDLWTKSSDVCMQKDMKLCSEHVTALINESLTIFTKTYIKLHRLNSNVRYPVGYYSIYKRTGAILTIRKSSRGWIIADGWVISLHLTGIYPPVIAGQIIPLSCIRDHFTTVLLCSIGFPWSNKT